MKREHLDDAHAERLKLLNEALAQCLRGKNEIHMLEAGADRKLTFSAAMKKVTITSIDISKVQLD